MTFGTVSQRVWKRFVQEGVLDASRLQKRISESWLRCKKEGVNPHSGEGKQVLTNEPFQRRKKENALLLDIAIPYVDKLLKYIKGSHSIVLLIDPQGYVLTIKGDKEVLRLAQRINFIEGVKWTEEEVGTNAIGTSLIIKEPITVVGSEHYSLASQQWTCSAAPICNDEGTILGVINVSSPVQYHHPLTLGAVVSTAYAIEREWEIRKQNDRLELIQQSFDLLHTNIPVVICNRKKRIVCASQNVRTEVPQWEMMQVKDLKEFGYMERRCTPLYSYRHGGHIGFCIHLIYTKQKILPYTKEIKEASVSFFFPGETGTSEAFQRTLRDMERVACTEANVHIYGESGTGKEWIARAIHQNSAYKNGPFIAVNCGAIPRDLMESELFGYVEGAFTGARRQGHQGKFEQANHGTIFLDEIGEISPAMQVALLRVLQEREVTPIGGKKEIPLNIRVITATHRDLRQMVQEGTFREDLFYRLYVFPIHVPALRERKEDIPYLIRYYCRKNHWNVEIPGVIMEKIVEYDWPGNIRELFNVLERLRILSGGNTPDPSLVEHLFVHRKNIISRGPSCVKQEKPLTFREELQKQEIIQALQKTGGNASLAAKLLNIPRSTFYRRLQKYQL
ncbi:sigma-54-dependent Fis family transcriptional regulator [Thermoactinomyces sp. CICC 10521]|uniref:sigma-54-dependent Fis family transcriptional regulator n=1 Tax=Thermoactinomyces sp. CICC 10521 TaxID=2767426 RepID=UPI0018DBFB50|nr:sigma-54-dependent Fis family transcriptional regulator [Thermoactinomyces sp. CICC 10521]MBH8609259.1 sigma-54-dependent Fis family transcriptional regulator [Thermoactinomyces sp. CICC 10521]